MSDESTFEETFTNKGGHIRSDERSVNKIYVYRMDSRGYEKLLKIGDTEREVKVRVGEQDGIGLPYNNKTILYQTEAIRDDGSVFRDHQVHAELIKMGKKRMPHHTTKRPTEFFECTEEEAISAINAVKAGKSFKTPRTKNYKMRDEQQDAVEKTISYYEKCKQDPDSLPAKYLWNAKMRFGKTFTAYQLAKKMGAKKILVITFQPVVSNAWEDELKTHVDFDGWQFVSRTGKQYSEIDTEKPFVWFVSFQDILTVKRGIFKPRNNPIFDIEWDLVILDEYHYGAWRDNARSLFESTDFDEDAFLGQLGSGDPQTSPDTAPLSKLISSDFFLYLSGTPFRAIYSGEFREDQIYTWSYVDEQQKKAEDPDNPAYSVLPRMFLFTYNLPPKLKDSRFEQGGYFDLNEFFKATGEGKEAKFVHEEDVVYWLELMTGSHTERKPYDENSDLNPYPFACTHFKRELTHTFWLLPSIAACDAMENLLNEHLVSFFDDYTVINESGDKGGSGRDAYLNVMDKIGSPEDAIKTKTITLSCGKLTMGVTVEPWTGVFMLCSLRAPETYFQAAFRAQSPWVVYDSHDHTMVENHKPQCYVFDFDPNRTLCLLGEYCSAGFSSNNNTTEKIEELLNFMPVISCEDSRVKQANVQDIVNALYTNLENMGRAYWQSPDLFNITADSLKMLSSNEELRKRLMSIQDSSSGTDEVPHISISQWEKYNEKKKKKGPDEEENSEEDESNGDDGAPSEEDIDQERKFWREKLKALSNRINVFMYLTDPSEENYSDILETTEPELFKLVTGLEISDLKLMLEYDLIDRASLNRRIWGFMNIEKRTFEEYPN